MAKNPFNDIVPPDKKSIRNIQRTKRPTETSSVESDVHPGENSIPHEPEHNYEGVDIAAQQTRNTSTRGGFRNRSGIFLARYGMWFLALAVLLILTVAFSLFFAGSKIVVTPKQKEVTISGEFTAVREPVGDQLAYDVVELSDERSVTVASTGTETVQQHASGVITVFNNFSERSQRLITNTRFETPDGLIYRIREPIVVPGMDGDEPGSIEVTVYADEPGSSHNIGLVDFSIPGFAGTPQFDGFYARSKTPVTGGFVGERAAVDEETLEETLENLEQQLRTALRERAHQERPEEYEFFDNAISYQFSEPKLSRSGNDQAEITLSATASAFIFRSHELASKIADETVAGYDGEDVYIENISSLALTPVATPTDDMEEFTFTLNGSARIIWLFDEDSLKADLSGRAKEALPTVLSGYSGIETAEIILRPFWKQSFPDDPNRIRVDIR